ncbi:hypothetical protein LCGC14_0344690 [marine sediment metagenome]|uniref:Uncharacterized protein n=1 Tax=marine sediment metagenome TaxID=412755 RepID=A0A0F9WKH9_9ZZZZ
MGDWAICSRCGDEILPWMDSGEKPVCGSCYCIDDRERFAAPEESKRILEAEEYEDSIKLGDGTLAEEEDDEPEE